MEKYIAVHINSKTLSRVVGIYSCTFCFDIFKNYYTFNLLPIQILRNECIYWNYSDTMGEHFDF